MKAGIALAILSLACGSSAFAQKPPDQLACLETDGYARGVISTQNPPKPAAAADPVFVLKLVKPRCAILSEEQDDKPDDKPVRIEKLETIQLIPKSAADRDAIKQAGKARVNVHIHSWLPSPALKVADAATSSFSIGETTDRVSTNSGELVVGKHFRKETKATCAKPPYSPKFEGDECRVIRVNGQPFMAAPHIGIEKIYPNIDNPQVVMVWTHVGGNINPTWYHLVDVTGKTPKVFFTGEGVSRRITPAENGIAFQAMSGKDSLGDGILRRYSYAFGSGRPVLTKKGIDYSTTPVGSKARPAEIFSDLRLRKPLLDAIGKKHFAEYRKKMEITGGVTLYSGRYFFASGCKPHDCCGNETAFVLDVIDKKAWALEESSPTCSPSDRLVGIWGKNPPDDSFAKERLEEWLKDRGVQWSAVKSQEPVQ